MRAGIKGRWERCAVKRWAGKRFHLSRGKRLVLNLVVTVFVSLGLWGMAGYPLPTIEMEFRRAERQWMMPPSEIVFTAKYGAGLKALDGTALEWTRATAIGVRGDVAVVACSSRTDRDLDTIELFALDDGPTPVPVTMSHLMWVEVTRTDGKMDSRPRIDEILILLRMPQEAATGELELDVTYQEQTYHPVCPLFPMENGVWIAAVESPEGPYSSDWYEGGDYTLRLYEENGALLLEKTGVIPKSM